MTPCILLRSHNDMPLIGKTLEALHRQDHPFRLIALDNESTDGTREELLKYTDAIETIPRGTYVPGRVLNRGMSMSTGELVVFLNSDCTPQHQEWLRNLLQGFDRDRTAAVFGRQIPPAGLPSPPCQGHGRHLRGRRETAILAALFFHGRFGDPQVCLEGHAFS